MKCARKSEQRDPGKMEQHRHRLLPVFPCDGAVRVYSFAPCRHPLLNGRMNGEAKKQKLRLVYTLLDNNKRYHRHHEAINLCRHSCVPRWIERKELKKNTEKQAVSG
ncbi:Uncharacterized protein APZ42_031010 [Daphnia magna]|uniref:Uncharacterized protein n=1 Tax=Daphnia magna TaxID=35525 RepID=A0A164N9I6_9CRUS|nr:Uncharacterized protein APZ42_031010 [Daphnia magna]